MWSAIDHAPSRTAAVGTLSMRSAPARNDRHAPRPGFFRLAAGFACEGNAAVFGGVAGAGADAAGGEDGAGVADAEGNGARSSARAGAPKRSNAHVAVKMGARGIH